MSRPFLLRTAIVGVLCISPMAHGVLVVYDFEGIAKWSSTGIGPDGACFETNASPDNHVDLVGGAVTGRFSYETDSFAPFRQTDGGTGLLYLLDESTSNFFQFQVDGCSNTIRRPIQFSSVKNDLSSIGQFADIFTLRFFADKGPLLGEEEAAGLGFSVRQPQPSDVLTDTTVPTELRLTDWDRVFGEIVTESTVTGVSFDLVSLSRVEVPEPSTLGLLGAGLLGLWFIRRRRAA